MTGRPPLPVGTWGEVATRRGPAGWIAEARFRDTDGVTRKVKRTAATAGGARNALTAALKARAARSGDGDLSPESTVRALATEWLLEVKGKRSPSTLATYTGTTERHILTRIGGLRLREVTVPRLERMLGEVAEATGAQTAKHCRNCLQGMWGLAVRHGAASTNPARDTGVIRVESKDVRALTAEELAKLRAHATPDVADFVAVGLGTGARISDILALAWADVDLSAGTVVLAEQKKGGRRLILELPAFTVAALLARRVRQEHGTTGDLIFPSAHGTRLDPSNFRREWREVAKAAGVPWATPHTLRKTVATALERELGEEVAAAQLGDHLATARKHYIAKGLEGPKVGDALERALGVSAA